MKVYAINGSPRKSWNTAMLLENAPKGAAALGAETELIHLYDLDFKGCTSCEDYDKVVFNYFDPEERKQRRIDVFPEDCRKASELGGKLVIEARQAATMPL